MSESSFVQEEQEQGGLLRQSEASQRNKSQQRFYVLAGLVVVVLVAVVATVVVAVNHRNDDDDDKSSGNNPAIPPPTVIATTATLTPSTAATTTTTTTASPTTTPTPTTAPTVVQCGCATCTPAVWNTMTVDNFTCGQRILHHLVAFSNANANNNETTTTTEACAVISELFPTTCGPSCHPDRCDTCPIPVVPLPNQTTTSTPLESSPNPSYCFPFLLERAIYRNAWNNDNNDNGYTLHVKETTASQGICGPGYNVFGRDSVHYNDTTVELTLEYKYVDGNKGWQSAEVAVQRNANTNGGNTTTSESTTTTIPWTYGTYSMRIKEAAVVLRDNSDTTTFVSHQLPADMVIGMFTFDEAAEQLKAPYGREIDVEISQWRQVACFDVNLFFVCLFVIHVSTQRIVFLCLNSLSVLNLVFPIQHPGRPQCTIPRSTLLGRRTAISQKGTILHGRNARQLPHSKSNL